MNVYHLDEEPRNWQKSGFCVWSPGADNVETPAFVR